MYSTHTTTIFAETMRMPVAAKLARQLYHERIIELKLRIKWDIQIFKTIGAIRKVVTEIDEIRTGKLDGKLKEILKEREELRKELQEAGPSSVAVVPLPQQEVKQSSQQIILTHVNESEPAQAVSSSTAQQQQHQRAFNTTIKQEASPSASIPGSSIEIQDVQLNQAIPQVINKITDVSSDKNTSLIQLGQIKKEGISGKNIEKLDIIPTEAVASKNEVEINSSTVLSSTVTSEEDGLSAAVTVNNEISGGKTASLISKDTKNLHSESGISTTDISYPSSILIEVDSEADETEDINMTAEPSVGKTIALGEITSQEFSFNREALETIEEESPMQEVELVDRIDKMQNSVSTSPIAVDDNKFNEHAEQIISMAIDRQNDSEILELGNHHAVSKEVSRRLQLEEDLIKSEQLEKDKITNEVNTKQEGIFVDNQSYDGKAFDFMDIDSSRSINVRRRSSHDTAKLQQKSNVDKELPRQGFVKRLIKESPSYTPLAPSDFETPLTISGDAEEVERIDDNAMEIDQAEDFFIQDSFPIQGKGKGKGIAQGNNRSENQQPFSGIDIADTTSSSSYEHQHIDSIDASKISFNKDGRIAEELPAISDINITTQRISSVDDIFREQSSVKEEPSDDDDVQMVDVYSDVEDAFKHETERSVQDKQEKGISLIETFTNISKESPTESKEISSPIELSEVMGIPVEIKHDLGPAESKKQDENSVKIRDTINFIDAQKQIIISGESKELEDLTESNEEMKIEEKEHEVVAGSIELINPLELKQTVSSTESKDITEIKEKIINSEKLKELSSPREVVSPTSSFKDPITPSVNASTPSADAGITPHSVSEIAQTPGADIPESASAEKRHKTWQRLVNMLLQEFANHRYAGLFQNPIREIDAPGYYNIVKQPMDLKTIKKHIREGIITDTDKFERDVMLMFMNALVFNRESTDVHKMTVSMRDQVEKLLKEFKQSENSRGAYEPTTRRKSMASIDGARKRKGSKLQE
ncbi:11956_t:CDS:2 [Ambispora gerdemannii]|uniref:11956_t:CDS:1 n=1 Tax=Ambispora gerdemannii TaxID=144530 RepID=A0A9N8Z978_9GLOM|nr:11956_t:CDS:2 [Ambispora gerdemannii]